MEHRARNADRDRPDDADVQPLRRRRRPRGLLRRGGRLMLLRPATGGGERGAHREQRGKRRRGEPCGPPRPNCEHPGCYLTVEGMPLILPAFRSAYCLATAVRIAPLTFVLHLP